ncbi:FAD-dependent oxidoreductase [uncultured Sphaerochaeta sp.]|uniref:phytoene desaturase family protein n=1 Tax=uncultured Sphaerochaeta sp. TaxID=886478 RepID=UPI002AA89497|nr:FAD-dependent oxidoreductase [uncultured Sphaerochaeta sp.]
MKERYDVVVVGGGIAGLVASAYCARSGCSVLLCEQQEKLGGLVNSFERDGFIYDQGIRAIENSGIIFPMLEQLGIEIPWVRSPVTLAVGDEKIVVESKESFAGYQAMLENLYPQNKQDIAAIMEEIKKITTYMDVLYGIDNPMFLDSYDDFSYVRKTLLPWLFKYMKTIGKIGKLNEPVAKYLQKFTNNQALIDIIAQHFFADTPTFFALSYFGLYLEYQYPIGGTGALPRALEDYLRSHDVDIQLNYPVTKIDVEQQTIEGRIKYDHLIWAADLKQLYRILKTNPPRNPKTQETIEKTSNLLETKHGGDSIFSLFVATDLPPSYFKERSTPHLFYTPNNKGLSTVKTKALDPEIHDKDKIKEYLKAYLETTTYEISIPVLRDPNLAPPGKTAIIISTLASYELFKRIENDGWYEEAKQFSQEHMIKTLASSLYEGLEEHILDAFTSTPRTIEKLTSNSEGAITGWAFTEGEVPVIHSMKKITKSVITPLPHISQAGQWSFSPSGLPISVMTGKLAAGRAIKELGKK